MDVSDPNAKQDFLGAMADTHSRRILMGADEEARSATSMSLESNAPLSTVCRKGKELQEKGLLFVERSELTKDGKWQDLYRSRVKRIEAHIDGRSVGVVTTLDDTPTDRFAKIWPELKER